MDKNYKIICGSNIESLKEIPDNYFDSVVTDPPYGLGKEPDAAEMLKAWVETGYLEITGKGFMGKEWDAFVPQPLFWKEVFRVLKPGGHIVAFYGTRTYDWGVMAMRIAGFEIRDGLQWLYGSGFPKSFNVAKKIDEILGNEREIIGIDNNPERFKNYKEQDGVERKNFNDKITKGNSKYEGYGTALKPAVEPIVLARKPLEKGLSIAENVIKWGTGGINVDGCRISTQDNLNGGSYGNSTREEDDFFKGKKPAGAGDFVQPEGRFPANLILSHHPDCCFNGVKKIGSGEKKYHEDGDTTTASEGWHNNNKSMFTHKNADVIASYGEETVEDWTCVDGCPIKIMNEQSGVTKSSGGVNTNFDNKFFKNIGGGIGSNAGGLGDVGGASRFFYTAKTSKSEKNFGLDGLEQKRSSNYGNNGFSSANPKHSIQSNFHPTVKPVRLMQYLARLITPPNGKVLDPFNGSGTTGIACVLEGFEYTGLELDEEYCKISEARISAWNEIEEYEDYKKIIESQVPEEEINKYGKQTDLFIE
jgi:site-specific DNA-methyltransferase (adenine-specific)